MSYIIRNLRIENSVSGKITPVPEVGSKVTASKLIEALKGKLDIPPGYSGKLTRARNNMELRPSQTLEDAGIEDGETLIADLDYVPGA